MYTNYCIVHILLYCTQIILLLTKYYIVHKLILLYKIILLYTNYLFYTNYFIVYLYFICLCNFLSPHSDDVTASPPVCMIYGTSSAYQLWHMSISIRYGTAGWIDNNMSAIQRRSTGIAITSILKFISHPYESNDSNTGRSYTECIVRLWIFLYHLCQPVYEFPCGRT